MSKNIKKGSVFYYINKKIDNTEKLELLKLYIIIKVFLYSNLFEQIKISKFS